MAKQSAVKVMTTGDIAAKLGKPRHVVWRAIRRLGIEPIKGAGSAMLYDEKHVTAIRNRIKIGRVPAKAKVAKK